MGITSISRVFTRRDCYGKRRMLQPGNREWVTAIEQPLRMDGLFHLLLSVVI